MKQLKNRLARLSAGTVVPHLLLVVLSGIAAVWLLGAFVDTLNLSIRQGEALRESQRTPAVGAASHR